MAGPDDDRRLPAVPLRPVERREVIKLLRTQRRDMFRSQREREMKKRGKSGPAAKAAEAQESFDAEVSEAFRRARYQLTQITADLDRLRRRAATAVKPPHRPANSSK